MRKRGIDRAEVERTLEGPDYDEAAEPPRRILMRRFFDAELRQEMLLCAVVEDTMSERVVVTAYKTSRIAKYLKGRTP